MSVLPLLRTIAGERPRVAAPITGVRNYFDPVRTATENAIYNNNGSVTTGIANGVAGHGFIALGPMPVVADDFAITLSAADDILFNAARINFHNSATISAGTLVGSVTTGVTLSSDLKTISCAQSSIPMGATHWVTNAKYAPGSTYAATNDIPSGFTADLLPLIMFNRGARACCLTAYGASDVEETASGTPDLQTSGKFFIFLHGNKLGFRWAHDDTHDLVELSVLQKQSYNNNADYQPGSMVLIPKGTPAAETPGAYAERYIPSDQVPNPYTYYIVNDNSPAYRLNGDYCGGNHGIPSFRLEITGHGFTNASGRGTAVSQGSFAGLITRIDGANHVIVTGDITGIYEYWSRNAFAPTAGTLTTVAGNKTIVSVTSSQLYPSLQRVKRSLLVNGGQRIEEYGTYEATAARILINYQIPNSLATMEFVAANIGNSDDIYFNDPSILSHVDVVLEYQFWRRPTRRVRYQVTALLAHIRTSMWDQQEQQLTNIVSEGETIEFLARATNPIATSGGPTRDFAVWNDVTLNGHEYTIGDADLADVWADGGIRAPQLFAYRVKDSNGDITKAFGLANSPFEGRTASPGFSSQYLLLSQFNKAYPGSDHNRDIGEDEATVSVGAFGPLNVGEDPEADIYFPVPMGGGAFEFHWHRTSPTLLSGHMIPVLPEWVGRRIRFEGNVYASLSLGLADGDVIEAGGIPTDGTGGFSAVIH